MLHSDISADISLHGIAIVNYNGDGSTPSFSHTVGFTSTFNFEIIFVGLPCVYASLILNDINSKLQKYERIELNKPDDRWANMPVVFKETNDKVREYVRTADIFYGRPVRVIQAVMPDKKCNFPWHSDFDHDYMDIRQPMLFT